MKKIWLTTLAVGAFAVPVGVASAQTADDLMDDDTTTMQECDGDRQRLHDGSGDGTQARRQGRQSEAAGDLDRAQDRTEDCDGCDGEPIGRHQQLRDGAGGHARVAGRGR